MRLIGLDFGSTTTSALVARASARGGIECRSELTDLAIEFRSEPIFTPYEGESLDETALAAWLNAWAATASDSPAAERSSPDWRRKRTTPASSVASCASVSARR